MAGATGVADFHSLHFKKLNENPAKEAYLGNYQLVLKRGEKLDYSPLD